MIKALRLLFGLVISGLCLWAMLSGSLVGASLTAIAEKIGGISVMWVFFALGSLVLSYPLNSVRLKYVLSFNQVCYCKFLPLLSIVWASSFLSLVLPSAAFSDGIKAALLRAARISNLSFAIRAVIVDRSMGVIYTLGIAGVLLLILQFKINSGIADYFWIFFLLSFLGLYAVIFFISKLINKIPIFMSLSNLVNDMNRLMYSPKTVVLFLGFAIANTTVSALNLWCIARGFSVEVSFWIFFMLTPVILIVNNLPIFYQGFGGREATMLFAFGNFSSGIPPDLVLTISLVSGVAMMVSALFGSIFLPFLLLPRNESSLS